MTVFIDTGAFFDFLFEGSSNHEQAIEKMKGVQNGLWGSIVTSNYILDELITLLCRRADHSVALRCVNGIRKSHSITIIFINEQYEKWAWNSFKRSRDSGISFTDHTSFVLIDIFGIDTVFSNDGHFEDAGYALL